MNEPNQYVQRAQQFNRPHRTGRTNSENNNMAFDKGFHRADDDRESAFQYQPTPNGVNALMKGMDNGASSTPEDTAPVTEQQGQTMPNITEETVRKGMEILRKYKKGKGRLEDKVVRNEKWWKMRHWDLLEDENTKDDPKPASGWLFNTIISKHADYMDSFPTSDILPREIGDVEEAKRLSSIIPVIMSQNEYKKVYSEEVYNKLKHGTGIYGIFWDTGKLNGLGDVNIKSIDLLSIFWEPGVTDIQKSENIFTVELTDNKILESQYPQTQGQLSKTQDTLIKKYWYDESIDTTGKSAVIDWYYHKTVNGKKTLQYIKFVDDIVLYATEDDPQWASRGLYDHGKYPFVFDVLFPEAGMPIGFGFVDVCKNAQTSIDIFNNCIEKNMQFACSPRYFNRNDGAINKEEFANPNQLLIGVDGNLGEDSIRAVDPPNLINGNYINILEQKINEMKETAGNRDATTGGTQSGVTAASAIAAMQESAGKTSRDQIARTYEAHKEVVYFVIELVRQFYDMPRQFRILGERGQQEFIQYTNVGLQPQYQGMEFGQDMGYRLPVFDIDVKAEKESAYTQLSQNELALQFYNQGFFNPQYADQAMACIDMMEFQNKEQISERIQQNGSLYQQLLQCQQQLIQMAEMVDQLNAQNGNQTQFADVAAQAVNENMGGAMGNPGNGDVTMPTGAAESSVTSNARAAAQSATSPR